MTIDMGKPIKTWVYVQKNPGMGTCGHLLNAGDTVHAIRYPYFTYTECPACAETTEKIEREKASK